MSNIKVSIAGGTGYTAGELLRILYQHPDVEVISVSSTSKAGESFHKAHPDLEGLFSIPFSATPDLTADVLFLCLGHEVSRPFLEQLNNLPDSLKIIDLSRDFRLKNDRNFNGREFVYGLPELNREKIQIAENIANPGCFATTIQLALLPIAKKKLIQNDVHVSAITGSTGAGGKLSETTHFSWRDNNISVYKAFRHQHLDEIQQSVAQLQQKTKPIHFLPMRGNFSRGIYANIYTPTNLTAEQAKEIYRNYYKEHPFVQVGDQPISMKNVVNTNRCFLEVNVIDGQLLIHSVTDNLVKGASGQAVQNMNLIFGLPETTGLQLKPTML